MEYLEITDGKGHRRRVELKRDRLLVGREPTCDVYLPHPNVSRRHAQIQRNPQGHWILQDLNSLNHVYVDERPVQQIVLENGKEVRIANYRLTLLEASTIIEPGKTAIAVPESGESWTSVGPAWLDQLHTFQRGLLHIDQPRQVLERLAEEFCRLAQPQAVAVGTAGAERYHWEVLVCPGGEPDQPTLDEALRHAVSEDSDVQSWTPERRNGEDTPGPVPPLCLLFPMKGRSGVIGHVYVLRPRLGPPAPEVRRYLALLATGAGLVWDNLHLAVLRSAQKQIDQELRQARHIQTELFPPTFDVHEGLNAFAVNLPSVRVSGDYYDLVRTGPSTVAFVVADAMGHGMPAALMMAAVRAGLLMGLSLEQSWEKVFQGLDRIIAQARAGAFVTGVVGQIDLARHELQIVSAGHVLPSILVGGKPVPVPPECQTRPWGLDFESPWRVGRIALGPADWSIICYTDGILDGGARTGDALTGERVAAYHLANQHLSAEDLCQGLLSEAANRQASGSLVDDQTVLVLRSTRPGDRPKPPTLHDG
jgi:serine phosphatase RsbU (regulator of sigma subunit)